jgi:hypothetical protein
MSDRPRSAAAALYPHLPHDKGIVQSQREQPRLADALYPSLVPKPPIDPYYDYYLRYMKSWGLVPIDEGKR